MTKVYNSKSNAIRAFKTHYPDTAAGLDNATIASDWLDEDDGGYILIDPAVVAAGLAEDAAREAAAAAPPPVQALELHNTSLPKTGNDLGFCPHCNECTDGGDNVTEFSEMSPGTQRDTNQQFTCNSCAGEWGPLADKPKLTAAGRVRSTIDSPVKRMWDMLDATPGIARKDAVQWGIAQGISPNTAATQFQWWRKARGLVKAKV